MSEYHEPKWFDFKFLRDAREHKQQSKVPKIQNVTIKSLKKHIDSIKRRAAQSTDRLR